MAQVRARWLAFYSEHVEPVSKEIFSYVEKMIIGTLVISAGAHVSSNEPAIVLFGYLRHGLIGRGVMLFGVILLLLNFIDGLYKLARLNWHIAYQILMTILYFALSVRLIQLILAFSSSRGRIGRSTITVGAAGAAAAAPAAAGAAPAAGAAAVAPPPLAAETAFSQPAESFALFFSRHCSAGAPPVGTPAQTFG